MARLTLTALALLTVQVAAQNLTPLADGNASISGTIVDDLGKAIPGAEVGVSREGPYIQLPRTVTDPAGRFVFDRLPAGDYTLWAAKRAHVDASYGQLRRGGESTTLRLASNTARTGVILTMPRAATISGRVVDDLNQPAAGIQVKAMRRSTVNGHPRLESGGSGTSDDRGEYIIHQLSAGDYIVLVMSRSSNGGVASARTTYRVSAGVPLPEFRVPPNLSYLMDNDGRTIMMSYGTPLPPPADDGRLQAYVAAINGGADTPAAAPPIVLRNGERRENVDLQLQIRPAVRLSGTIVGPNGLLNGALLRLVPVGFEDAPHVNHITASARPDGRFAFLRVPSGRYTLEAELRLPPMMDNAIDTTGSLQIAMNCVVSEDREQHWLRQPLEVDDSDVTELALVLRQGVAVRATVAFEGSAAPTPSIDRASISLDAFEEPLRGVYLERRDANTLTGRAKPGRYVVRAGPIGQWHFKTALARSLPIGDGPIDVGTDGDIDLQLVFTDRPAGVNGTVVAETDESANNASVLLFPVDREAWNDLGPSPWRARMVRARNGVFSMRAVAPREYFVVAVDDTELEDWSAPEFLRSLTPLAQRISIGDGEQRQVDLRLKKSINR
jgi:hypothetical protein